MDWTGARREGREESYFFREIAEAMITKVHPSSRDPLRSEIVKSWRLAGYQLASYLLPVRHKRFPEELSALLQGMRQRMEEYETENLGPASVEQFDVNQCEKLEEKAEKLLRLATHERTPPDEARNAALGLAKMIAGSELTLLGLERVRHFAQKFADMQMLFTVIRQENPLMFLYGAKEQQGNR